MSPKRSRSATAAAAAAAVPAKLAAAALSSLSLELRAGKVDALNADYWRELDNALETINGHPLFHNMVGEEPHINFADATGVLEAGNLFWLDLRWSATAWGAVEHLQCEKPVQHRV